MSDVTQRLLETLSSVDVIAAEDTRVTRQLLSKFDIDTHCIRFDIHKEKTQSSSILDLLFSGKDVALVSDAGTPAISDPGSQLIQQLEEYDISIIPIPGCSAVSTLVSIAGLHQASYLFSGFVPKKEVLFGEQLAVYSNLGIPCVFFESPHRIMKTFKFLNDYYPTTLCVVAKELTKIYETVLRGSVHEVYQKLHNVTIKGEWCFALVFEDAQIDDSNINTEFIKTCKSLNLSNRDIITLCVQLGMKKNNVYNYIQQNY